MDTTRLSEIKPHPDNPRFIRGTEFESLKASIEEDPGLLLGRGILTQRATGYIIGGEMRWRALQELTRDPDFRAAIGTDKPGVVPAAWITALDVDTDTAARLRIKDNGHYGKWDDDILSGYDTELLKDWGVDVPVFDPPEMPGIIEGTGETKQATEKTAICPKCGEVMAL